MEEQGQALRMAQRKLSQAEKDTLPKQKYTRTCRNKLEGWNDLGLNRFNELMDEVEEDQESKLMAGSLKRNSSGWQWHSADKGKGRGRCQCKRYKSQNKK